MMWMPTNLPVISVLSWRHWVCSFLHLTRPEASFTPTAEDADEFEESELTTAFLNSVITRLLWSHLKTYQLLQHSELIANMPRVDPGAVSKWLSV